MARFSWHDLIGYIYVSIWQNRLIFGTFLTQRRRITPVSLFLVFFLAALTRHVHEHARRTNITYLGIL